MSRSVYNPDLSQTSMDSRIAVHEKPLLFGSAVRWGVNSQILKEPAASQPVEFCVLECEQQD